MTDKELEKKLLKKARKLAKFAMENGYNHIDVFAVGPDESSPSWFVYGLMDSSDVLDDVVVRGFYEGSEL